MIVKDLIIELLKMPQHKEIVVDTKAKGISLPVSNLVVDDSTNSVVISLEE